MRTLRAGALVVALALALVPALAQTAAVQASVAIRNESCTAGVQLSQIV